jgi:N-methylhydantoinase B
MVLHEHTPPDFVREHDIDHVTLDIIENALKNIRYEMDRVLVTTAVSPIIREQADEFPLIADRKGRMVVGQFGSPVDTVLENSPYRVEDLKDGDVIALNDPYMMEGSVPGEGRCCARPLSRSYARVVIALLRCASYHA